MANLNVITTEQAIEKLQWYLCRWQIEIFFRILKSGCKVEKLQLESDQRLRPAVAMYMIVAWRVLYLTMLGRECPQLRSDRRVEGVTFFTDLIKKRAAQMPVAQRLVSLAALGILRAETASSVPLLGRIKWVEDTIAMLEETRALGGDEVFFSRLATGLVYADLPDRFNKSVQAEEDLNWLVEHSELAPNPGLMRAVYQKLAQIDAENPAGGTIEDTVESSGLTTNFSVSPVDGATFYPQSFEEILPGRVYLVSGLEFTEYYFILSKDRQHLISIDAGTRADFARAAYNKLRDNVPDLPLLSTVLVTHAHWDHVGGHEFFRLLNPAARFYGRANFQDEIDIMEAGPGNEFGWFFGEKFSFPQ